jgi:hypothetical protein
MRRVATLVVVAAFAACGDDAHTTVREGLDASTAVYDAGTEPDGTDLEPTIVPPSPRCRHEDPIERVEALAELNTSATEQSARLTSDERLIYFASERIDGGSDIFVARREAVTQPFGPPELVEGGVNTSDHELHPSVAAGTLAFQRQDAIYIGDTEVTDGGAEEPYLLANALYYVHDYRLERADFTGASLGPPRDLAEINDAGTVHLLPTPSEDELTLYFTDGAGIRPNGPTFYATRDDASAPFGPSYAVTSLPDSGFIAPTSANFATFISRDACRIYFHRGGDLFVAHRTPH